MLKSLDIMKDKNTLDQLSIQSGPHLLADGKQLKDCLLSTSNLANYANSILSHQEIENMVSRVVMEVTKEYTKLHKRKKQKVLESRPLQEISQAPGDSIMEFIYPSTEATAPTGYRCKLCEKNFEYASDKKLKLTTVFLYMEQHSRGLKHTKGLVKTQLKKEICSKCNKQRHHDQNKKS